MTASYRWLRFSWKPICVMIIGGLLYSLFIPMAYDIREKYVTETISEFGQTPSLGIQISSLEFKGALADYFLFRTLTYVGLRIGENKTPSAEEWDTVYQLLDRITDLDPRFWDPYLFAETMFAWQGGDRVGQANVLLEKAVSNRPEDYRPLYFIGFNHLYFGKDVIKAAPYLRKASELPKAPVYLQRLASRVSVYAGQTHLGIVFLETLLKDMQNPNTAELLKRRLEALKILLYLEEKVKEYKEKYSRMPKTLEALVTSGIIPALPEDPYGGKFILTQTGRVYTTSELLEKKLDPATKN